MYRFTFKKLFGIALLAMLVMPAFGGTPLSGTYTINAGQPASATNFTSFTMAADSINTNGVGSAVVINVAAGTYTDVLALNTIAGASATNSVTIDGGSASATTLSSDGSTSEATIALNGSDYVTIKNLTVVNSKATNDAWGIHLTGQANYVTIDNVVINMATITAFTDVAGIVASGSLTASSTAGDNAHNLTISNTTVNGGYYGYRHEGGNISSNNVDSNITVQNSVFNNNIAYGIYLDDVAIVDITGNTISGAGLATKDGLYFGDINDFNIQSNQIWVDDYAIYLFDANFEATAPAAKSKIINNMLYSTADEALRVDDFEMAEIFHNTLKTDGSTGEAEAFFVNDIADVDIRNNIFYANEGRAFYSSDAPSTYTNVTVDFNVYNSVSGNLAYVGSSANEYATLAAWQAVDTSFNVNSLEGDPVFFSATDLHCFGTVANDAGDNTVSVTTDFDGDTRPASGSTMVDIGADEFTPPSCAPPTNLMVFNTKNVSTHVTWTTGGASNWMVQYETAGFTLGSGNIMATANDTILLSSLLPQTTYDVYVKDSCGSSTSPWMGPITFTTFCNPSAAPFTENFDGLALTSPFTALPSCWSTQVGPDFWGVTNDVVNNGHSFLPNIGDHTTDSTNYMWLDASGGITANQMATGLIDLSTLNNPLVGFWFASNNTNNSVNHTIALDAWNGTAWTTLTTESGNFADWEEISVVVPSSIPDTTRFRIYAIEDSVNTSSNFYNDLGVDDFFVVEAPSCPQPNNLGATNITTSSADIFWTTGGSMYHNIEYGPIGFTQGTGMMMTVSSDTASLTSLFANTAYDFFVRDSCFGNGYSLWSGPFTFQTLCNSFTAPFTEDFEGATNTCWTQEFVTSGKAWTFATGAGGGVVNAAHGGTLNARHTGSSGGPHVTKLISPIIDASALTQTQIAFWYAQENWVADQNYTALYYRDSTTGAWNYLWSDSNSVNTWTEVLLTIPSTSATLQVAFEGTDNFGRASVVDDVMIREKPACTDPVALGVINVTSSSADAFWTAGSTTTNNFTIEYGIAGFTQGTGGTYFISTTNDTTTIPGLLPNTAYDFYVMDSCGAGSQSAWVGPFTFNSSCVSINAFPYTEGFEGSTWVIPGSACNYADGLDDCWSRMPNGYTPMSWVMRTGNTCSGSTGPIGAANGNNYIYLETSSSGADATLMLPDVDVTSLSKPSISFNYHMYGAAIGKLYTEISTDGGITWSILDSIVGAQHNADTDPWTNKIVAINGTGVIKLRFRGTYGGSFTGDIALDDVTVGEGPNCPAPSFLGATNITTTSADIFWTGNASGNFVVEYDFAGFIPGTGSGTIVATTNDTLTISPLTPNTAYDFYVLDSCGAGDLSTLSGPYTFTTPCNSFTAPFHEDFEATTGNFSCWSQEYVTGSKDWTTGGGASGGSVSSAYAGTSNARHTSSSGGPHTTKMVSPIVDVSGLSITKLAFAYAQEDWSDDQNSLAVYYRDAISNPWVLLWSDTTDQSSWVVDTITIPSTSATLQVAFEATDVFGRAVVVDEVMISDFVVVPCVDPTNVMATAGCDSAVVSWASDPTTTGSAVEYGAVGFTPGMGQGTVMAATSPFTISSLMMGTAYDVYVVDSCASGSSNWSTVVSFTTDTLPTVAASHVVTTVTGTDATVDFTATGTGTSYSWDFGDGNSGTGATPTHIYTANGTYQVVVTATNNCGTSTSSIQVDIQGIDIDEYGFGNVSLYPNPNQGVFTITGITAFGSDAKVEVINTVGSVVYSQKLNASSQESISIDLSGMAPGMYQLRVSSSKGAGVKPFIIRN